MQPETVTKASPKLAPKLSGIMAIFAFIACNGTIILVALLSTFGISLTINPHIQAAAISLFAFMAAIFVLIEHKKHGNKGPVILAMVSAAIVLITMYIAYHKVAESIGLIALIGSTIWSWYLSRAPKPSPVQP